MKILFTQPLIGLCLMLASGQTVAESFNASINDPAWDGKKVPNGQQCQKFGGNPMSPEIKITGIPEGTEAIVLRFNDETYFQLKNGGHGKIAMLVESGTTELIFPSVPGHTVDLPEGVLLVSKHKAPGWDKAGAYLPPCSGGERNMYSVTVQASKIRNLKKKKFKKIAKVRVPMGRY